MEKIENIEKVFIVIGKKVRKVVPYKYYDVETDCNFYAVFPNRKQAEKFVSYFTTSNGKSSFDILERKLA